MMDNTRDILINLNCYKKSGDDMYFKWTLENFKSELLHNKKHLEYEIQEIEKNLELIELIKKESE